MAPANSRFVLDLQEVNSTVITEVQYPISPGISTATVPYLEDLIDPLLKYVRPSFLTPGAAAYVPEEMTTNIRGFKVRFAEALPGSLPSFTQDTFVTKAIKGGIGSLNFIATAIVNDGVHTDLVALPPNGRFLTHVPSGRLQRPDEWGWLLYLCTENEAVRNVTYEVLYADGLSASITRAVPNAGAGDTTYRNWYIPTGVAQCGLDPTSRGVISYTIRVVHGAGFPPTIVASYTIMVDNRPYYHPFTLHYRNSLGGWDNLCLRGEAEHSADAERSEYARSINDSINGTANWYNTSLRPKFKCFTGYMSGEHLTALQDLMLSSECAILLGSSWLPVRVASKSLTHFNSRDSLHSAQLELESAGSHVAFPKQILDLI